MPHKTWIHKCDKNNDAETVLGVEVCSDCGLRGQFNGWQLGMHMAFITRWSFPLCVR